VLHFAAEAGAFVQSRTEVAAEAVAGEGVAQHEVAPVDTNGVAPPADDAPGGWQEAGTPMAAEEPPVQAGARLAGTKFTIET
jgi:hypothetical protein